MKEWLLEHDWLMALIAVGSLLGFVVGLLIASWAVVRMPADALLAHGAHRDAHPVRKVIRNAFGVFVILVGIALLFLPGQGLITIALGLMLVDFPRKHDFVVWLLGRGGIHRAIDRMRARRGRPPLLLPGDPPPDQLHGPGHPDDLHGPHAEDPRASSPPSTGAQDAAADSTTACDTSRPPQ